MQLKRLNSERLYSGRLQFYSASPPFCVLLSAAVFLPLYLELEGRDTPHTWITNSRYEIKSIQNHRARWYIFSCTLQCKTSLWFTTALVYTTYHNAILGAVSSFHHIVKHWPSGRHTPALPCHGRGGLTTMHDLSGTAWPCTAPWCRDWRRGQISTAHGRLAHQSREPRCRDGGIARLWG